MKTEHEKLKEIIDLTNCKISSDFTWDKDYKMFMKRYNEYSINSEYFEREVDVREIIFYPEFRDKFIEYGLESGDYDGYETYRDIWKYLEDPTNYLYNLLELGNH